MVLRKLSLSPTKSQISSRYFTLAAEIWNPCFHSLLLENVLVIRLAARSYHLMP